MVIGYVLMDIDLDKRKHIESEIKKIEYITETFFVQYGEMDYVLKVEADDFASLGQAVMEKIRYIDGVTDTKTLTCVL
ncbi:MAG: Lrp/AsnC family transcriptional regulator [Candidatus Aenigmarchaeota archaeon]|nr:Lrp/AsnC family transcriptional regulator [Candidatus Aenigmarchaeota archaeon]